MTTASDQLVHTRDVERQLGLPAGDLSRIPEKYGVRIIRDWAGRPAIKATLAAQLREKHLANVEANRRRKAENEARQARERETFENDRERRYWTAYAAVAEHGGVYGAREAAGVAFAVISAEDPENELARVIKQFGQPSERAILFVMGRTRETSTTGRAKEAPKWLR